MTDAYIITQRQWETYQAEVLRERAVARRRFREGLDGTQDYWMGYEAACNTLLNAMRRVSQREPVADIEDILTE